ncbi:MAG: FeoB-associated Cys-rich membrane protein [Lachnospiraceae bacterium]|nr:FeoB-associated Cys-rich membrane protein [Lachnospiraceae bacterium]
MGTLIVLLILAGAVGLIIRSMVKDKKAGKSLQCGQDCSRCGGHCHYVQEQKDGQRQ